MTEPDRADLPEWPRLMSEELATRYLSIGRTMLAEQGPEPQFVGRRKLWDRKALDRWADALAGIPLEGKDRELEQRERDRRFQERMSRTPL